MRKVLLVLAVMVAGMTFGTVSASAQGPAGVGAGAAASSESSHSPSSHSFNPVHWIKKDSKKEADTSASTADSGQIKRLTERLQSQGLVAANADVKQLCINFKDLGDCVAAIRASHALDLNFGCVSANATGVKTGMDTSSCRMADTDKPLSLVKTIKLLKPEADAKSAVKDAESLANEDLKETGA